MIFKRLQNTYGYDGNSDCPFHSETSMFMICFAVSSRRNAAQLQVDLISIDSPWVVHQRRLERYFIGPLINHSPRSCQTENEYGARTGLGLPMVMRLIPPVPSAFCRDDFLDFQGHDKREHRSHCYRDSGWRGSSATGKGVASRI